MTNEERKAQERIKANLKQIIDRMNITARDIPALAAALHCTPNEIFLEREANNGN